MRILRIPRNMQRIRENQRESGACRGRGFRSISTIFMLSKPRSY
jgi:hypothetical protein